MSLDLRRSPHQKTCVISLLFISSGLLGMIVNEGVLPWIIPSKDFPDNSLNPNLIEDEEHFPNR